MRKIKILAIGLCLLLGFATAAQAGAVDAFAIFTFYNPAGDILAQTERPAGNFTITNENLGVNIFNAGGLNGSFNFRADPRIEYSFGFVNGATNLPFTVQFVLEGFSPALTGQTQGRAQFAAAVTDNPTTNWSINTFELAPVLQTNFVDTDTDHTTGLVPFAPLGAASSGAGPGSIIDSTAGNGIAFVNGPLLAGDYTSFLTVLSADVSAFDGVTFTGNCELNNVVPIPGSLVLLGSGIIGLMGLRLRRRS